MHSEIITWEKRKAIKKKKRRVGDEEHSPENIL